ncbi:unnamed protein product [Vitrella brassicaformis CCMP3155]|uniref:Uncharacterized protein n=1 Tax=Vitrella brassicaformis (strain CCMP3155) TaxID=1169540 RepID=A0A0G4GL02_VITBC|nr:unnamed protein product [Vitrella brassicaformis CCMP3155]|eukprot:CEM30714.1 unnamed protein product [Vitrella brassicaformis CCMP3155]
MSSEDPPNPPLPAAEDAQGSDQPSGQPQPLQPRELATPAPGVRDVSPTPVSAPAGQQRGRNAVEAYKYDASTSPLAPVASGGSSRLDRGPSLGPVEVLASAFGRAISQRAWTQEQLEDLQCGLADVLWEVNPANPANHHLTQTEIQQRVQQGNAGDEQGRGTGGLGLSANTNGASEGVSGPAPPPPPPQPQLAVIPPPEQSRNDAGRPSTTEQTSTSAAASAAAASAPPAQQYTSSADPLITPLPPAIGHHHRPTARADDEIARWAREDVAAWAAGIQDAELTNIDNELKYHQERQLEVERRIQTVTLGDSHTSAVPLQQLLHYKQLIGQDVQRCRRLRYARIAAINAAQTAGRQRADPPIQGLGERLAATHSAATVSYRGDAQQHITDQPPPPPPPHTTRVLDPLWTASAPTSGRPATTAQPQSGSQAGSSVYPPAVVVAEGGQRRCAHGAAEEGGSVFVRSSDQRDRQARTSTSWADPRERLKEKRELLYGLLMTRLDRRLFNIATATVGTLAIEQMNGTALWKALVRHMEPQADHHLQLLADQLTSLPRAPTAEIAATNIRSIENEILDAGGTLDTEKTRLQRYKDTLPTHMLPHVKLIETARHQVNHMLESNPEAELAGLRRLRPLTMEELSTQLIRHERNENPNLDYLQPVLQLPGGTDKKGAAMLANHKSGGGQGRQEQGGGGGNRQANQPTYASGTPPRGQKWTPVPKSSGASRRTQQTSGSASGGGNKAPGHGNHESLPRPKASDGLVSQEEIDKRTAENKCPRADDEIARRAKEDVAAWAAGLYNAELTDIDNELVYHKERGLEVERLIQAVTLGDSHTSAVPLQQLFHYKQLIGQDVQRCRRQRYARIAAINAAQTAGRQRADPPIQGQGERLAATHSAATVSYPGDAQQHITDQPPPPPPPHTTRVLDPLWSSSAPASGRPATTAQPQSGSQAGSSVHPPAVVGAEGGQGRCAHGAAEDGGSVFVRSSDQRDRQARTSTSCADPRCPGRGTGADRGSPRSSDDDRYRSHSSRRRSRTRSPEDQKGFNPPAELKYDKDVFSRWRVWKRNMESVAIFSWRLKEVLTDEPDPSDSERLKDKREMLYGLLMTRLDRRLFNIATATVGTLAIQQMNGTAVWKALVRHMEPQADHHLQLLADQLTSLPRAPTAEIAATNIRSIENEILDAGGTLDKEETRLQRYKDTLPTHMLPHVKLIETARNQLSGMIDNNPQAELAGLRRPRPLTMEGLSTQLIRHERNENPNLDYLQPVLQLPGGTDKQGAAMVANHKSGGGQGRQAQGGGGGNRQANQPTYASGTPPRGQKWTPKGSGASQRTQQTSASASGGGNASGGGSKAPGHGNHESLPRPKASDGLVSQEEIDERTAENKCPWCGKGGHEYYECYRHRAELIKRGGRFANLPPRWSPKQTGGGKGRDGGGHAVRLAVSEEPEPAAALGNALTPLHSPGPPPSTGSDDSAYYAAAEPSVGPDLSAPHSTLFHFNEDRQQLPDVSDGESATLLLEGDGEAAAMDGGAATHIFRDKKFLIPGSERPTPGLTIKTAHEGQDLDIECEGKAIIGVTDENGFQRLMKLSPVYVAPDCPTTLISERQLHARGGGVHKVAGEADHAYLYWHVVGIDGIRQTCVVPLTCAVGGYRLMVWPWTTADDKRTDERTARDPLQSGGGHTHEGVCPSDSSGDGGDAGGANVGDHRQQQRIWTSLVYLMMTVLIMCALLSCMRIYTTDITTRWPPATQPSATIPTVRHSHHPFGPSLFLDHFSYPLNPSPSPGLPFLGGSESGGGETSTWTSMTDTGGAAGADGDTTQQQQQQQQVQQPPSQHVQLEIAERPQRDKRPPARAEEERYQWHRPIPPLDPTCRSGQQESHPATGVQREHASGGVQPDGESRAAVDNVVVEAGESPAAEPVSQQERPEGEGAVIAVPVEEEEPSDGAQLPSAQSFGSPPTQPSKAAAIPPIPPPAHQPSDAPLHHSNMHCAGGDAQPADHRSEAYESQLRGQAEKERNAADQAKRSLGEEGMEAAFVVDCLVGEGTMVTSQNPTADVIFAATLEGYINGTNGTLHDHQTHALWAYKGDVGVTNDDSTKSSVECLIHPSGAAGGAEETFLVNCMKVGGGLYCTAPPDNPSAAVIFEATPATWDDTRSTPIGRLRHDFCAHDGDGVAECLNDLPARSTIKAATAPLTSHSSAASPAATTPASHFGTTLRPPDIPLPRGGDIDRVEKGMSAVGAVGGYLTDGSSPSKAHSIADGMLFSHFGNVSRIGDDSLVIHQATHALTLDSVTAPVIRQMVLDSNGAGADYAKSNKMDSRFLRHEDVCYHHVCQLV